MFTHFAQIRSTDRNGQRNVHLRYYRHPKSVRHLIHNVYGREYSPKIIKLEIPQK